MSDDLSDIWKEADMAYCKIRGTRKTMKSSVRLAGPQLGIRLGTS